MKTSALAASSSSRSGVQDIVLDSGALIGCATTSLIASLGSDCRVWTIPDVIAEVRDSKSRQALEALPFKLLTRKIEPESLRAVSEFAVLTGDFHSLSATDLRVLAASYSLEIERFGRKNLRPHPKRIDLSSALSKSVSERRKTLVSFDDVPPRHCSFNAEDFLNMSPSQFDAKYVGEVVSEPYTPSSPVRAMSSPSAAVVQEPLEDEDGEGVWITSENLSQVQSGSGGHQQEEEQEPSSVACITVDYAMQNVMLQMGLRLLSLDGRTLRTVKRWILRCYACGKLTDEMERQFCDKCGGNTLSRSSVRVNAKGWVRFRHSTWKEQNKRGTKFSLPKPKGGRQHKDMILREDQLKNFKFERRGKTIDELFDEAQEFGYRNKADSNIKQVVGHHLRNPNAVRKSGGGKRRTRR